jgi:drug/metabolite transporter (DMT)-like permease
VFETLAALAYAYALRGQWPQPLTLLGAALLIAGVLTGLRGGSARPPAAPSAEAVQP